MFDPSIGRWTTEDPELFEAGDNNFYRAFGNSPIVNTDPEGLAVTKVIVESSHRPVVGLDGVFIWPVTFELDGPADACDGGWIVQHVKSVINIKDKPERVEDYWEAWRVKPSKKGLTPTAMPGFIADAIQVRGLFSSGNMKDINNMKANDWFWNTEKVPTTGQVLMTGHVYYFDKLGENAGPGLWAGSTHLIRLESL